MKDKQRMRFHVVPRADIPDLFGEGTAVRIGRKYVEKPRSLTVSEIGHS